MTQSGEPGIAPSRAGSLHLLGGHPCLDFTNTTSGRGTPERLDHLREYGHLLAWAGHAGIVGETRLAALGEAAARDPAAAHAVLRRALALREAFHASLTAHLDGGAPRADDLATIDAEWRAMAPHRALVPAGPGAGWAWRDDGADLDAVLWPVTAAGVALLTAPEELGRVGRCAACNCGWLFLDRTKNRSRRWCQMSDCGNRHKARRWYDRAKRAAQAGRA